MADSASESYLQAGASSLKYISGSLFSILGFLVGFGNRISSESESLRSPTPPLDFKCFWNLSSPFSLRSNLSSESGNEEKSNSCEVGLAIINSLLNEFLPSSGVVDSPNRKIVLFGPQVKTKMPITSRHRIRSIDSAMTSNSLPNYIISPLLDRNFPNSLGSSKKVFGCTITLEPNVDEDMALIMSDSSRTSSSLIDSRQFDNSSCESGFMRKVADPLVSDCSRGANSLTIKSTSLPIDIDSNHVGSLSAREIELSEDYTCIISHGPNPKTTHIFGDCILECHTNELQILCNEENQESPQVAKHPGESNLDPAADDNLSLRGSWEKYLEEEEDILTYSSKSIYQGIAENEKTCDNSISSFLGSQMRSENGSGEEDHLFMKSCRRKSGFRIQPWMISKNFLTFAMAYIFVHGYLTICYYLCCLPMSFDIYPSSIDLNIGCLNKSM